MKSYLPLVLVLGLLFACSSPPASKATDFKVIVLGFDGVDPDLVSQWMDHLPNIRRLSEQGTFSALGTTNPPESPVAWASFSTGMNPGKHGIFDFLRRDPETYYPDIGLVQIEKAKFILGSIPIKAPKVTKIWILPVFPPLTCGYHWNSRPRNCTVDPPGQG